MFHPQPAEIPPGVFSYAVAARTREFGIRITLGAWASQQGCRPALALTRVMGSLLYAVKPSDPATYVAVSAFLSGAALAACIGPALRAAGVNPVEALRAE